MYPNKRFETFAKAVKDIPDGASVMLGGFGPGTPHNLLKALFEQGAKDLTLILNSAGAGRAQPGFVTTATLIEARRVKKIMAAFTAATHPSQRSVLEDLQESGQIEAELMPQGTLAERIRCGGVGIPAFYTPAAVGTELAEGKEHRVFNGRTYLLEEAITADYAFVRAKRGDEFGNLVYQGSERNFNPLMATAARCTIVETEEIVPIGELDPNQIHTPGIYVHRMVQMPPGAILHAPRGGEPILVPAAGGGGGA
jgi:3-oxoadipate CoA-transferase alpha subunit